MLKSEYKIKKEPHKYYDQVWTIYRRGNKITSLLTIKEAKRIKHILEVS
jgi:hypothetical protein